MPAAAAARWARRRTAGCCSSTSARACSSTPTCPRWCACCRHGWCWRSPSTRRCREAPSSAALLAPLLDGGARLAVDDTGSGYASLEHVVELRPEFLKLSGRLVTGLDRDPGRLALVRALAAFAREVGSSVVAEGVEREGERLALLAAGVEHAQGWLLARPGTALAGAGQPAAPGTAGPPCLREPDRGTSEALARCPDTRTACQAAVAHLARRPGWMPSVYLHVAGRLRLQSQHGYWHVYDGMPVEAGIMGRTFLGGETVHVRDVNQEHDYVDAVPGLVSELSVPLRVDGVVAGVLNVESAVQLPDTAERVVDVVVARLAERLAQLGLPGESRARQLGRHTAALTEAAGRGDLEAVHARATEAVRELSGLGSRPRGRARAVRSAPAGGQRPARPRAAVARPRHPDDDAAGVSSGQTGYTAGVPGGRAPGTQAALTAAGVRTVITLPVGDVLLVGADRATTALVAEDVEVLEVLAGQLAGCLQTVRAVVALRERAECDPLTGLGNRARFRRCLAELAGRPFACRLSRRRPVQAGQRRARARRGRPAAGRCRRTVAAQTRAGEHALFRLGGDEFAFVLPGSGLGETVGRARAVASAVRALDAGVTVSVGVTVTAGGEPGAACSHARTRPSTTRRTPDATACASGRSSGGRGRTSVPRVRVPDHA